MVILLNCPKRLDVPLLGKSEVGNVGQRVVKIIYNYIIGKWREFYLTEGSKDKIGWGKLWLRKISNFLKK